MEYKNPVDVTGDFIYLVDPVGCLEHRCLCLRVQLVSTELGTTWS